MDYTSIQYLIKVSVALFLFYGIYILLLRKDTFNNIKRFYLLSAIITSLLLPICNINFSVLPATAETFSFLLPQVEITSEGASVATNQSAVLYSIFSYILFGIGGILFIRLIIQILSVLKIKSESHSYNIDGTKIFETNDNIAPFSFLNWVFIPQNIPDGYDKKTMIIHEKIHVRQKHSYDTIFCELFCIFFWWNPFAWLIKKEIRVNLEYLADEGVLKKGLEAKGYQYLLLQITNSNASIQIVNNFNVSQLKKRIIMINKEKSRKLLTAKYLFALPIALFVLSMNISSSYAKNIISNEDAIELKQAEDKEPVYQTVEIMPEYPGGTSELMKYIVQNLKYPADAVTNKIEGLVIVRFTVSKTGDVTNTEIMRSLSPSCDAEAIRVIENMPKWKPGKEKGKEVAVYYTFPIRYQLPKEKKEPE